MVLASLFCLLMEKLLMVGSLSTDAFARRDSANRSIVPFVEDVCHVVL